MAPGCPGLAQALFKTHSCLQMVTKKECQPSLLGSSSPPPSHSAAAPSSPSPQRVSPPLPACPLSLRSTLASVLCLLPTVPHLHDLMAIPHPFDSLHHLRFEASQRLSRRRGWTFSLAFISRESLRVSSSLNQSIFQTFHLFLLGVMGHEYI